MSAHTFRQREYLARNSRTARQDMRRSEGNWRGTPKSVYVPSVRMTRWKRIKQSLVHEYGQLWFGWAVLITAVYGASLWFAIVVAMAWFGVQK